MGDRQDTMEHTPPGRRERNKQRVRNRIYTAAVELFTRQGYDQTTVDEITEEADVARGTFFNHFQRKEDLITAWGEERRQILRDGLASENLDARADNPRHALMRCMSLLAEISLQDSAQTRAMLTAWVNAGFPLHEQPFVSQIFTELLEAGRKSGKVPDSVDTRLAGYLLRDVYFGTLYRWIQQSDAATDLEAELHAACKLILDGAIAD